MKKIAYIFLAIAATLSCSKEMIMESAKDNCKNQIVDGMLEVEFSIKDDSFKPSTKALSHTPHIESMKVVVFDQHGVYMSQCDATLKKINDGKGTYNANFPVSEKDEKRIIHFLANCTDEVEYGTELESISKIVTTDGVDGYWQRVEVDNLKAVEQDGELVLLCQDQLKNITLLRNFCSFEVSSDPQTSNLEILGAAIFNLPDRGSIAPYSSDKSTFVGKNGGFVSDYTKYKSPKELIDDGYSACVPIDRKLIGIDSDFEFTPVVDGKVVLYGYERETPVDNPPYIIIKGKFKGSDQITYYKITQIDKGNKAAYAILRNFEYKIEVKEVKSAGMSTPEEAAASTGSGDISTDTRFQDLPDISNGEARLMVTETEVMLVTDDPVTIKYKFLPSIKSDVSSNGEDVKITLGQAGATGAIFNSITDVVKDIEDDAEGWRTITVYPNAPGTSPRKQTITIVGAYHDPEDIGKEGVKDLTLTRVITFTLREKPVFSATVLNHSKAPSKIHSISQTPFFLRIGVPGGLPASIFPLQLEIESDKNTISPVDHLPVSSRKSVFDSTKPAIVYTKTLNFSEYENAPLVEGERIIDLEFKTNTPSSACAIRVDNKYFVSAQASLQNYEQILSWTGSDATKEGKYPILGGSTTVQVKIPSSSTNVKFSADGKNYTAGTKVGTDGEYTIYSYTVNNISGSFVDLDVQMTLSSGETVTITDLGTIPVWQPRVTQNSTALTSRSDVNNRNNTEGRMENGKRVWDGIIIRHKDRNVYLRIKNGTIEVGNATTPEEGYYFFQSNGQSTLRSFNGEYLSVSDNGSSLSNYTFGTSQSSGYSMSYNNSGWIIGGSEYKLRYYQSSIWGAYSLGTTNSTNNSNRYWTIYPATMEYVEP